MFLSACFPLPNLRQKNPSKVSSFKEEPKSTSQKGSEEMSMSMLKNKEEGNRKIMGKEAVGSSVAMMFHRTFRMRNSFL